MDNSNQFPGLLLRLARRSDKAGIYQLHCVGESEAWRTQINYGCDYLVRSPDTSGLWASSDQWLFIMCCVFPLHKCVVWRWGASVWLDVICSNPDYPSYLGWTSHNSFLSAHIFIIRDTRYWFRPSHNDITYHYCDTDLFCPLRDLVVIIWIMWRKLNFDHEMPLTLGLNVSNDHLLMISISYHHFYVLFISYTMISYNSDSRAHSRPLARVSRSAAIQIKTGLVGKSLD